MNIKSTVAIGIGAALFTVLKMYVQIPIGPNSSFIIAMALLTILGAYYGPIAGFFIGFIGHALSDMLLYGGVWWSWVFMSAMIGLFAGFITLDKTFSINEGKITNKHIAKLYLYAFLGMVFGTIISYIGDVKFYGEPADKVLLQIILANLANLAVIAVIGVPAVIILAKRNAKVIGIDEDDHLF